MQVTAVRLSKNIHNRFRLADPAVHRQIFGPGSWAELEDLPPAAAGETLPVFVGRAVETQAQRDSIARKMKKAPDKKSEA